VAALKQYGELFMDDPGVPQYSGDLADQWGSRSGPPAQFLTIGQKRPVLKFTKINSVDEMRLALKNYRPCTYAIDWYYRPELGVRDVKGYRVMKKGRLMGGHQTCMLYWNDEIDGAFNLNSWGEQSFAGTTSALNEPPGGAYALRADIEQDMSQQNVEVYSIDVLEADPSEAWNGIFGRGGN
jgi:hypothetical protein